MDVKTQVLNAMKKEGIPLQTRVDSFVKKYSAAFTTVAETFSYDCNDFILDKKVKASWNKTDQYLKVHRFYSSFSNCLA